MQRNARMLLGYSIQNYYSQMGTSKLCVTMALNVRECAVNSELEKVYFRNALRRYQQRIRANNVVNYTLETVLFLREYNDQVGENGLKQYLNRFHGKFTHIYHVVSHVRSHVLCHILSHVLSHIQVTWSSLSYMLLHFRLSRIIHFIIVCTSHSLLFSLFVICNVRIMKHK